MWQISHWFSVIFLLLLTTGLQAQIEGQLFFPDHSPVPGATVLLLPDSLYTSSDARGRFAFEGLEDGSYGLQTSFIGYENGNIVIEVADGRSNFIHYEFEETAVLLESVEVTDEHAKQESSLASSHFGDQLIQENLQGTFARSIEKLPGISSIQVGVGIAKPVIRGLSANRIIVTQNGVKQEGQQWGSDHGLEIDPYSIERVEIIKGPASLQYGSDGLGGVINIMPAKVPATNSLSGQIQGVYKSNNNHWGTAASLRFNRNDIFFLARYSRQQFEDYRVPASQFEYNDFVLPIYNERLKNTAGLEQNYAAELGIQRSWGQSRLSFSRYELDAGLFSGAVGIPRSYALEDDGDPGDIDVPSQSVRHSKFSYNQSVLLPEGHIQINAGYQLNQRREFSFPEFHSIPSSQIDPGQTLALGFDLQTWSVNAHYEGHGMKRGKLVLGGNAQWQDNRRSGFEFLLPDFRTFRSGLFALREMPFGESWILNTGLRLDYGHNDTDFYRQYIWNSNEVITDSLLALPTDDPFFNWSASVGANYEIKPQKWYLKLNFGKSFRIPYPAETVSNGIHHGTFRHEMGTPELDSEQGYQFDASMDWVGERFSANVSAYFNYFQDYIYLGPTFPAKFSPLPEAGQLFRYRQDDAIYTGFEGQWNWEVADFMELKQAIDFVQSINLDTRLALPFTPQPAIKTDVRFEHKTNRWLQAVHLELGHQYHLAASGNWRIDRSEVATPAYHLWNVGMEVDVHIKRFTAQLNVQVQNLFDTAYLNHLSRYRILNVPEQGRNLVVSLRLPFN
ncbi:MAG: TonB-dependent receptor [Bacteroidetes bacterium]|nr:TonB-dependent receptor [Bacteroidota bacterium]